VTLSASAGNAGPVLGFLNSSDYWLLLANKTADD